MPRKPSKKTLIKKLDDMFSKVVRGIGWCEKCHSTENLQCAHINSRRFYHTRWNQLNAVCLCAGCHFWAHQHPRAFGKWVDEYLGEGTMDSIDKLSNLTDPISIEELQEIYEKLKLQLQ